jgi:protein involved in polysaccharide export with SLBB domain
MYRKTEVPTVVIWHGVVAALLTLTCVGCQGLSQGDAVSAELAAFENAGQMPPVIDLEKLTKAPPPSGLYRVVAGDVLELQLPTVAVSASPEPSSKVETCLSRVCPGGSIRLPIVGDVQVMGQTLTEIESAVAAAYYPQYVVEPPAVVAKVVEYASIRVSVQGAVKEPGAYDLHSDERSLVPALMKAGGIVPEGAGQIRIRRSGAEDAETVNLPVKGVNVPFADVALFDGDAVEVERFDTPVLTVLGLVNKPGVFPCQPGVQYTLMQALAMAGGVHSVAQPELAKVYRRDADGKTVSATFRIDPAGSGSSARVALRPGDVVAVEPTVATQTRLFLSQLLRLGLGLNASYGLGG